MPSALVRFAAVTAALVTVAVPAFANDELQVDLPFERFTLDNGLDVVVHEDRKAPVIAVQVMYGVGSKDEPEGKTGFAHLFEHLMFNGTEHFDKDFFVALKDMGATEYNGTTNVDRTNYYQTVPKGALEQILFLESDRMGHLLGAVTQEKLDNQIGVVKNEKRLGEDRPFGMRVWTNIYENLYPVGHPYHHSTIGSMEDLDAATLDDVGGWFEQYYGAANAVLVLAGDIDAEEARPLVEKYFGHIPSGPPLIKAVADSVPLTEIKRGEFHDRVAQPRLYRTYVGPPTGDAKAPLLDIMARAMGQGKTSRLYRRLVDEEGIANNVTAFYGENLLSGEIFFITDAKSEEVLPRINAILDEEIAQFLKTGPTRDELSRAKTTYLSSEIRGLEAVSGKAASLAQGALFLDDPDFYVTDNLDRLQAARGADVRDAASSYLQAGYYELKVLPFPNYQTSAAAYDRSAGLPSRGKTGTLTFPEVEEATLSNGIRVVIAPRATVPVVQVAMQFDAGDATANVPVGDNEMPIRGLSDMVMNLMDTGTEDLTAQEIATAAEGLGAQIDFYNTRDDSRAYLSVLAPNAEEGLSLFADLITEASFPEDELETFRGQAVDGLRQERADMRALGVRALRGTVFGEDHPYGRAISVEGDIEALQSVDRDDLAAWKSAWLRPETATIFVSGDISRAEIVAELEEAFGDWSVPGEGPEKSVPERANPDGPQLIVVDKPDTQQSLILAGRIIDPTGMPEDTAIEAMNDSFGGNFLSRINMNLREDKGWSYGVRSGAGDAKGQRLFAIQAPVQADKTGPTIKELLAEIDGVIGNNPTSESELRQTVASVVGADAGRFETAQSVLSAMLDDSLYGRPLDYSANEAKRYELLTLDEVQSAARKVIDPKDLTWVVVGDWDEIRSQMDGLGLGEPRLLEID